MNTLLKNNNIINNDFNNINKVDINNISLKIIKDISVKNFKEELKFINILKNKIIKRAKAFNYNNNFKNNNNKVFILNLRVFKYYIFYKDILLDYKLINNKLIIIINKIKLSIKDIKNISIIINNKTKIFKKYYKNIKKLKVIYKKK